MYVTQIAVGYIEHQGLGRCVLFRSVFFTTQVNGYIGIEQSKLMQGEFAFGDIDTGACNI